MKTLLLATLLLLPVTARADSWEERQATPLRGEFFFQDTDLDAFLAEHPRAAIYLWSPHLPLSASGYPAFRAAADALGLASLVLLDPQADEAFARRAAAASGLPAGALQRLRALSLIRAGALLHYPSVLLFDVGKLLGAPIAGSRRGAYAELLRRRLAGEGGETRPSPLGPAVPHDVEVRKTTPLPAADLGYFFKPVWGTRWLGLHRGSGASSLFHLDEGRLLDSGTPNDAYVTPNDHRYVVHWGDARGTLGLSETGEFLHHAEDPAYAPASLLLDADFDVYEQSVGTLVAGEKRSLYRVLSVAADGQALIRDYTIQHRTAEAPAQVMGKSKVAAVCRNFADQGFSLPILSKDGKFLAVNTDFGGRAGRVYELSPRDPGTCTLKASLDAPIAKAAFSFDGRYLAFVAGMGGAYLYELPTKTLRHFEGLDVVLGPGTPLYPEFREDGSLLLGWLKDGGGILVVELGL